MVITARNPSSRISNTELKKHSFRFSRRRLFAALVQGSGFKVQDSGFRVQGSEFSLQCSVFTVFSVQRSGFIIQKVCLWSLRFRMHPPPDVRFLRHEYNMLDTDKRAKSWVSHRESVQFAGCYCIAYRSKLRNAGVSHTSTPYTIPGLSSCRLQGVHP